LNKGDIFTVYLDGVKMTVCILGFYSEEFSGEEMVVLAVINQDNMVYIPRDDLKRIFPDNRYLH